MEARYGDHMPDSRHLKSGVGFIGQQAAVTDQKCLDKGQCLFREGVCQDLPNLLPQTGGVTAPVLLFRCSEGHPAPLVGQQEDAFAGMVGSLLHSPWCGKTELKLTRYRLSRFQGNILVHIDPNRIGFPIQGGDAVSSAAIVSFVAVVRDLDLRFQNLPIRIRCRRQ